MNSLTDVNGSTAFSCVRVAEALILGTMMVGQATAFAPSYNKAVIAAARIFKLLDREPLIDASPNRGKTMVGICTYLCRDRHTYNK